MAIFDDVSVQMKEALKAKEETRLAALRGIRAAFLNECKKDNATTLPDDVAIGLLRMPDFYTRMHAASVIETLGAGLILLGLLLQAGFTLVAVKLLMVGLLIFFASPTATHALARAAMVRGLKPLLSGDGSRPSKR